MQLTNLERYPVGHHGFVAVCLCHEGGVSQSAVLVEKHASAGDGGWERDPSSSRGIVGIHGALVAVQW